MSNEKTETAAAIIEFVVEYIMNNPRMVEDCTGVEMRNEIIKAYSDENRK